MAMVMSVKIFSVDKDIVELRQVCCGLLVQKVWTVPLHAHMVPFFLKQDLLPNNVYS